MAKSKIKDAVPGMLEGFLESEGLELYSVEYVKEGKDMFLRVFIDKLPDENGEERFVGTDDCEKVSRYLGERLDTEDLIEKKYFLEVSSPGMDRELKTDDQYRRYVGRTVDISLYSSIDGEKNITAVLEGINDKSIEISDEQGNITLLPREQVAKTKLAVIF